MRLLRGAGGTREIMLHTRILSGSYARGADREHVAAAGHSVAIETNAGAGIGATDDNDCTALRTILDFAIEVFAARETIVRGQRARPSEWAQLQENRIVLTHLHLVSFFRNMTCVAGHMTKMSICREPVFAMARAHFMSGAGPIGEIMAADLHRADAQRDIAGSMLEEKLEGLHTRAVIEDLVLRVCCCLASAAPARLCGEGAS